MTARLTAGPFDGIAPATHFAKVSMCVLEKHIKRTRGVDLGGLLTWEDRVFFYIETGLDEMPRLPRWKTP
jgi:hypothetical protein